MPLFVAGDAGERTPHQGFGGTFSAREKQCGGGAQGSDQKFTGQMFPTSWQFEWHESSDGSWRLVNVVCLKIGQETGEGLGRQFPSPKR